MINSGPFNGTKVNTEKGRKNPGIAAVIDWAGKSRALAKESVQLPLIVTADLAPALLGRAHPDDPLRGTRLETRFPETSCRCCCPKMWSGGRPVKAR